MVPMVPNKLGLPNCDISYLSMSNKVGCYSVAR